MRITTKKEIEQLVKFLIDEHAGYNIFEIMEIYLGANNDKER